MNAVSESVSIAEYYAAAGSPFSKKDAEVIGPELHRLFSGGVVMSADIVKEARDQQSPLHPYFEWDDSIAGERYRITQAQGMTRNIEVRILDNRKGGKEEHVRAFFSVSAGAVKRGQNGCVTEREPRKWVTVNQVAESPDLAAQVTAAAKAELLSWAERYRKYRATFPAFEDAFHPVFEFTEALDQQARQ